MAKHSRTPQLSLFEEHQRRKVLSELVMIKKQFGEDVVSQILLHSVDPDFVSSSKKWVEQGDGSALRYLQRLGIRIRQKNRSFQITDKLGTFSFIDDHYYSGINFLLKSYASLFDMPFGVFDVARVPNSLRVLMGDYWDETKQHSGAVDYLVHLHQTESYDNTKFILKMLGGDFSEMRPIQIVNEWVKKQDPVFSRERFMNVSGKLLKFCVEGTTRDEWVEMVLLALKHDVDNQLCELLVKGVDERKMAAMKKKILNRLEKSLLIHKVFDHMVVKDLYAFMLTYGVDMAFMTAFVIRFRQVLRSYYHKPKYKPR